MRVLIFSTAYYPLVGGAEIAVKEITDRLGDEIEFDLITARIRSNLPKVERVGKVNVYRIGVGIETLDKLLVPFFGALKAWQLNRKNRYAYFWCIMVTFGSGVAYIANWFQRKVPIILTLQEGDSEEWLRHRWLGLIDLSWRLALARTTKLTAISNYLIERAKSLGYTGNACVIPNGVDVKKFKLPTSHSPLVPSHRITLITTSRLVEKNGVGDIIEALRYLPDNVCLKILGIGPLEKSLKLKVESLKLENRVEFVGFVRLEEIPTHLHKADIFVRPALSEGFGNSFVEAMAAGLPVIATPVGGIPDFLDDGVTGFFCEPENPRSVAAAVQRIIDNPDLVEEVKRNASKMVAERYDWDLVARDMKNKVFLNI